MSTHDPDDRLEELLRSALHEEAETVVPAGDGLSKIQRNVAGRRARQRWLRPTLALGSAAAVAAVGIGAYAVTHQPGRDTVGVIPGDTPTPTADTTSATASPTTAPVSAQKFPRLAIFPFTTATAEKAWETEFAQGHSPWEADPTSVAQSWVQNYLGVSEIDQVVQTTVSSDGSGADVELGRTMTAEQKQTVPVTIVHLVKYGNAWIAVGADDPQQKLTLSTPKPGSLATSPLQVTGPGYGVDEAVRFDVRDATTPTSYGTGLVSFGAGTPTWSAGVAFGQPTGPDGVLVAIEDSAADGGPARLVALPIQFGEASGSSTPAYFYAAKNGRIAEFHSSDGSAVRYVTSSQPGGGASDPQTDSTGDLVYYLQGGGTCANTLMSVSAAATDTTQTPDTVASPDAGYVIAGYAVGPQPGSASAQSTPIAYYETACDSSRSPQAKLVTVDGGGSQHVIGFPSIPPGIVADPSFEPDGVHLDAFVRTGNSGYLARYDTANDTSPTPTRNACPAYNTNDGLPQALEVTGAGELWFAVQTGSSMQVVHCAAGHAAVAFTIPGQDSPADVSVSPNGAAVLLTDDAGRVWRWDGNGTPTELSPSVPLQQISW